MSTFCDSSISKAKTEEVQCYCSFAVSNTKSVHQAIYICRTCNVEDNSNLCCCLGCSQLCHKDHDLDFVAFGDSYCDCGSSGCKLLVQSLEVAKDLVDPKESTYPNFIYNPKFSIHNFIEFEQREILLHQSIELVKESKDTFWTTLTQPPKCIFEHVAQSIGLYHLRTLFQDSGRLDDILSIAGFEWWVQVRSANPNESVSTGVDLHYDKDEEIASLFEVGIFPTISTVTYLTESAAQCQPTVIYDCAASNPVGFPIQDCLLSLPEIGKHVAFDGRLLHGAPSELLFFAENNIERNTNDENSQFPFRVTFPVNIWIGHKPFAVKPIDQSLVDKIILSISTLFPAFAQKPEYLSIDLSPCPEKLNKIKISPSDVNREDLGEWVTIPFVSNKSEWGKSEDETGLELSQWLPQLSIDEFLDIKNNKSKGAQTIKRRKVSQSHSSHQSAFTTYSLHYTNEAIAATLEYEEDPDAADNFADEFDNNLDL